MWRSVLVCLLVTDAQAFHAPICLGASGSLNYVVTPKQFSGRTMALPQELMIIDQPGTISPNVAPYFNANLDGTITLDAMNACIEAAYDVESGSQVRVSQCTGGPAQRFNWLPSGLGGKNFIQLKGTNQCLDVSDQKGGFVGTSLVLRDCGTTASWTFEESLPFAAQGPAEQTTVQYYLRHVALLAIVFAALGVVSLTAARWQKPRMAPAVMMVAPESAEEATSGAAPAPGGKKKKQKQPKQKVKSPVPAAVSAPVERVFFEGAPSATECIIPGASIITVVGLIPLGASLARQAWTRYKITNRRIEVQSGFQGKDVVQVSWREVDDVRWLRRWGGVAGDIVLTLKDGAKVEVRSVPDFERNLAFIMNLLGVDKTGKDVQIKCGYPDEKAEEYLAKVTAGELPPPVVEGDVWEDPIKPEEAP